MATRRGRDNYDGPWKEVLDNNLRDFLELCFPEVATGIDWAKPVEFLEQELQQLTARGLKGRQQVDKLVRVALQDGSQTYLLIHIEIQSQYDAHFALRILRYYARIFDRYQEELISLVVFGDSDPAWHPNEFRIERWGCRLWLRFPYVKLINMDREKLRQTRSIMSAFILAHIDTIETRKQPQARYERRIASYRRLLEQGFSGEQIRELLRFIDWLMRLPLDLEERAKQAYYALEEEYTVTYITSFERHGIAKGLEQGLAQGRKEGLEQGLEQGRIQGLRDGICLALTLKFGETGQSLVAMLAHITDRAQLQQIGHRLFTGATLEELQSLLEQEQ